MKPYELADKFLRCVDESGIAQRLYVRRVALGIGWQWGPAPPKHGLWTEVCFADSHEASAYVTGAKGGLTAFWRVLRLIEDVLEK